MKFGVSVLMQNYADFDRFEAAQAGSGNFVPSVPDSQIYSEGLRLGKLAEPLGFDSIWTVEHHFTPYTMVADPLRLLAYFAGCTERVNLGTMVSVLPWNDPVRMAEGVATIDEMLQGRELFLGVGRGTGKREFDGLRISMNETRGRFSESVEILRRALSGERFSFEGEFFHIPELEIRPKPYSSSEDILERLYMAWGSPESMPIAANLGLKPLMNPQRSWNDYVYELTDYFGIRRDAGYAPARPICATWVICCPTEAEAEERARKYYRQYADSALRHYELMGTHFDNTKDYETYAERSKILREIDDPLAIILEMYMQTYLWGTPDMCIERLTAMNDAMGPREIICPFFFGTMPASEAEASMRLFAKEVMPVARQLPERPIPGSVKRDLPPRSEGTDRIFAGSSKLVKSAGATPG